jgi:hypothetical protein
VTTACFSTGCHAPVVAQWRRRPTPDELAAVIAEEQQMRQRIGDLASSDQPAPVFGPLPTSATCTRAVFGCATHVLSLDLAARVHAATCAPDPLKVPASCGCTPESLPSPPAPEPVTQLPSGWVVPTPPAAPAGPVQPSMPTAGPVSLS